MIVDGSGRHQLKRVYSSASLWEAREILALLEQQRIPAMLLNENVAGHAGRPAVQSRHDGGRGSLGAGCRPRRPVHPADRRVPGCRVAALPGQRASLGVRGVPGGESGGLRSLLGLRPAEVADAAPVSPSCRAGPSHRPSATRRAAPGRSRRPASRPPARVAGRATPRPSAAHGSSSPVTSSSMSSPRRSTAPCRMPQVEPVDQDVGAARQPGQVGAGDGAGLEPRAGGQYGDLARAGPAPRVARDAGGPARPPRARAAASGRASRRGGRCRGPCPA